MRRKHYTAWQLEFLRIGYLLLNVRDLTREFNRHFGTRRTESSIRSALRKYKITCGRAPGERLVNRSRLFSPGQIRFIRENYAGRSIAEMTALFNKRFRSRLTRQQIKSFVSNRGIVSGLTGRFEEGHAPHNKGVRGYDCGGRSAETRFKPGNRPHTWVPVGSERVGKGGIRQRKISDTGYSPRDWKSVHSLLWEAHHGPVPKGHIVVFKNGNTRDIFIENLECISRVENMRRNTIHNLPEALADVCRLRGVLNRHINKRSGK